MSIIPFDIVLKTMFEAALVDIQKNQWLLDDIFGGLANDMLSKKIYGQKEIHAAKTWFLNNNIKVLLQFRLDLPTFPCITIAHSSSVESLDRASFADETNYDQDISPSNFTSNPKYVYQPFTPKSYDPLTGLVTFPDGIPTDILVAGMYLVSKTSGNTYQIISVEGIDSFKISTNVNDDFIDAYILPKYALLDAHSGGSFLRESYDIGIHAASDPIYTIYLHQLVWYILFRYKEAYLEARGFELSTQQSGPTSKNMELPNENIYSKYFTLQGITPVSFVKYVAPKLQGATTGILIADAPASPTPQIKDQAANQGWKPEGDK